MPKIVRSKASILDMARIWHYMAINAGTEVARSLVVKIDQTLDVLARYPLIGRERPELDYGGHKIRSFPAGDYVILYQARTGGVRIVRVVHGAMHLPNQVGKGQ